MRLINVNTLVLEQFSPNDVPSFAILSHTWGSDEEETTFIKFQAGEDRGSLGYLKIEAAAAETRRLKLDYLWVDTCCIDKTNITELSENINAMYRYYSEAQVCLAYLADVRADDPDEALFRSIWFTRGWTLQEMVASRDLRFYDKAWKSRGSKVRHITALAARTRVPPRLLRGSSEPSDYSVARRMAWAAGRATKRIEDGAYCLLGIFDVHMPMLYGEGANAFRRLQEEIIKRSIDLTIFAWNLPRPGAAATAAPVPVVEEHDAASSSSESQAPAPFDPPAALPAAHDSSGLIAAFQLPPLPVMPSLPTFQSSLSSLSLPSVEVTEVTEVTEVAEATKVTETAEATKGTAMTKVMEVAEVTEVTEAAEVTGVTELTKLAKMVKVTEVMEEAKGTEVTANATETPADNAHTLQVPPPSRRRRHKHHEHDYGYSNGLGHRHHGPPEHCLFAASPELFAPFADLRPFLEDFENFAVTNRGLFISGSISLRMAERPVSGDNSGATECIYTMLLGHLGGGKGDDCIGTAADQVLIGLPLLRIGPNIFQRDWASDLVKVTEEQAQRMRSVQATDWYILIDRRAANMARPELYRQAALHVPKTAAEIALASGGGKAIKGAARLAMQAVAPAHLWDAHDRVFLRPRPYGWVRYDMVLVLQYAVMVGGSGSGSGSGSGGGGGGSDSSIGASIVVLCRYRTLTEVPAVFVYDAAAHPYETALLLMPRSPRSCLMWPEFYALCPALRELTNSIKLRVGGGSGGTGTVRVLVNAAAVETKIDLGYAEADVHSLTLEATLVKY